MRKVWCVAHQTWDGVSSRPLTKRCSRGGVATHAEAVVRRRGWACLIECRIARARVLAPPTLAAMCPPTDHSTRTFTSGPWAQGCTLAIGCFSLRRTDDAVTSKLEND